MKRCTCCERLRPFERFSLVTARQNYYPHCKECVAEKQRKRRQQPGVLEAERARSREAWDLKPKSERKAKYRRVWLKMRYGMTEADYREMLTAQGGACAICGQDQERRNLSIDHDHETGAIRGILCDVCNRAIGLARDCPDRLKRMVRYLEHHAQSPSGRYMREERRTYRKRREAA